MKAKTLTLNSVTSESPVGYNLKTIKNYSLQGLPLSILSESGECENVWLAPKQSITVAEFRITQQVKNLHKRRLVQISK